MTKASTLKKIIDAISNFVTSANFECKSDGISLQALDSSCVSLVSLMLRADGFEHYRCDRSMTLGIDLDAMSKVFKCAGNDDIVTIKANDNPDTVSFMFESPKQTRFSNFEVKLMDIDSERVGIPEAKYNCVVNMPSGELQRICKELSVIGETVTVSCSKDSVQFSVDGDMGSGNIVCKQDMGVDEEEMITIKVQGEISFNYALNRLKSFTQATPLSKSVSLKLSPKLPIVVEYQIEGQGSISFYLAPKVQEDEDDMPTEE